MAENGTIKVAAIGDLHVTEEDGQSYRQLFGEMSQAADVIVLAGDLTNLGKPPEAEILADALRGCPAPIVAVLGNHDYESGSVAEVCDILRHSGVHLLDGQSVEFEGVGFVGVKGFPGGFGKRMLSAFGEPAIKAMVSESINEAMRLENAMRQVRTERALVVLHYAPVVETIEGEPLEIYPFLGSYLLAEAIDTAGADLAVHGHAHAGTEHGMTTGGVKVRNVAQPVIGRAFHVYHLPVRERVSAGTG